MRRRYIAVLAAVALLAGCTDDTAPVHDPVRGEHPTGVEAPREGVTRPPDTGDTERGLAAVPIVPGVFSVSCPSTHLAQDDPIVFPGESGRAHMHAFAGTTGPVIDEASTPVGVTGGSTTCTRPEDATGYWAPTLVRDDTFFLPGMVIIYYRTAGIRDTTTIVPLPAGLVMIAGQSTATTPQDLNVTSWGCGGTAFATPATIDLPVDCKGQPVRLKVSFPNCWDGQNLDSPNHQTHMAYSWELDGNKRECPATHPVPVPEVEANFRWNVDSLDGLALSSGGIYSGHADLMNGFDPAKMASLTAGCLNVPRRCGTVGGVDPP